MEPLDQTRRIGMESALSEMIVEAVGSLESRKSRWQVVERMGSVSGVDRRSISRIIVRRRMILMTSKCRSYSPIRVYVFCRHCVLSQCTCSFIWLFKISLSSHSVRESFSPHPPSECSSESYRRSSKSLSPSSSSLSLFVRCRSCSSGLRSQLYFSSHHW
jgi:hypothetical protein